MDTYKLNDEDFNEVVQFAVNYHICPGKKTTGRTTGEPRGLGAILDAFSSGKLVEIGVAKIMDAMVAGKEFGLDFDIWDGVSHQDKADIVKVFENGMEREPRMHVEIKRKSPGDRYLGPRISQMKTIDDLSHGNYALVYASLNIEPPSENIRLDDIVGMYMKKHSSSCFFSPFSILRGSVRLEYVITGKDLAKYGRLFKKGERLYEPEIFSPAKIFRSDRTCRHGWEEDGVVADQEVALSDREGVAPGEAGIMHLAGEAMRYKRESLSRRGEIRGTDYAFCCISNVDIGNNVFGHWKLPSGGCYNISLKPLGEKPELRNDNQFITVRRLRELIAQGSMKEPLEALKDVVKGM